MKPKTDAFFISERRAPLSRKTAWLAICSYGARAGLAVDAHTHMLRHACGFALADQGADTRLIGDDTLERRCKNSANQRDDPGEY